MEEITKVKINNVEYEISPLRMKHLKRITTLLSSTAPSGIYADLERWFPFILDSIKEKNASFNEEILQEATMDEINLAWAAIVNISGIVIRTKVGETKPTTTTVPASTGPASSADSQPPLATPTLQ